MTLFILYLLALLDGLLCGLRTSMGRHPFIRKRAYYARAAMRGISGAQIISTLALLALLPAPVQRHASRPVIPSLETPICHSCCTSLWSLVNRRIDG